MEIDELSNYGVSLEYISKFKEEGISSLYPPQAEAIKKGIMENRNILLSIPTASGKTFLATLATIKKTNRMKRKIVYVVPLVALANEKYQYYKEFFKGKLKVALSVGNLDSSNPRLSNYDMIICTTEKLDSLIRHDANWIRDVGLVVIDEIHLLNDPSRGPTLEILLIQLRSILPNSQIIGLSATVSNSNELAEWLDAELIESNFRPVDLHEGVANGNKIKFFDKDDIGLDASMRLESSILKDTIDKKKQAIFFVSTRRNAESLARDLSDDINKNLNIEEKHELEYIADDILNALGSPTSQCRKLASCVKKGSAFHHAGLVNSQKRIIEENFRKGLIKSICATPTLAMGVNLPAFRVILRDTKRYYSGIGSSYIPVMEYKQIVGRAGRPQYDDFGESIIISKSDSELDELTNRFILGEPEEIKSKLSVEPVLRSSILALISNSMTNSEDSLMEFFEKTFYSHQYGDIHSMENKIGKVLDQLIEWGFVSRVSDKLLPTKIGKRISELYLDPLTANKFISALENRNGKVHRIALIQLVSNTIEMRPLMSIRSSEVSDVEEFLSNNEQTLIDYIPTQWDLEFDDFMKSIKTTMFFEAWMDEKPEDYILRKFKVAPGEIRWRINIADWLMYSIYEISVLLGMREILGDVRKTRALLKHGIKEDLLPFVKLKGIGRVRARKLVKSGIKSVEELRKINPGRLSAIMGPTIAYNIKKQLGEEMDKPSTRKNVRSRQYSLYKF